MKIYTLQEVTYFYSPVVNKFFPKDSSNTVEAFKNKEDANKKVNELNIKKMKDICKRNILSKYIPDSENLTKTQQEFIASNSVIFEENFIARMSKIQIQDFMKVFNLEFYKANEIELK